MHRRQLSILIELAEDLVFGADQEKILVDAVTLIFDPDSRIDMRRYRARNFHPCIEIYVDLEVSDTHNRMVKKIQKQIKAFNRKMRKLLVRGSEIDAHLSQREAPSEFAFTWEMGSSSLWKIREIVHR